MKRFNFKSNKSRIIFSIIALGLIVAIWYGYKCNGKESCVSEITGQFVSKDVMITLPQGVVIAEVADTPASRELGLSGRQELRENEGMLFVFDHPGKYGFWMKDMLFPLDIIWINQNGIVVHIEKNVSPESYDALPRTNPQTFMNSVDASYVLEIPAGTAETYGIYLGSKVKIGE